MNKLDTEGDWHITKGRLKQKWTRVMDEDLQYAEDTQEELVGRLQKRTGQTLEPLQKAVKQSIVCKSS
jgi:uncharacterized protein YjbJ (UPF0337 family)